MVMLLQEFDITVVDKPRRANVVADYLSSIHHVDNDTTLIDDTFPDEHQFHIVVQTPWYANIVNYIVAN